MSPDIAELNVVRLQFARFGEKCRLYAPLYRQVTLAAVRDGLTTGKIPTVLGLGYDDVREAWNYYLAHENKGRPFVLIGHSQGTAILRELIRREIDGKAVQSRLVSALLIGTAIAIPVQKDVGGTFAHVPVCRTSSQTGCVITYSSFRSTAPPPPNTLFGRVQDGTMVAACTNPAALAGGEGQLRAYLDAKGGFLVDLNPSKPWVFRNKPISTPFVSVVGLLTARCTSNENATYLEITVHQGPSDLTARDIQGDGPNLGWGLHGVDMELALGNLVDLVGRQARAFMATRASR
jgi:hypothetical protein